MAETTPANIADELSDEFNSSIWTFYQTNLSARTRKEYLNIIRNFTKLTKTDPLKLTKEAAECYINELNARYTQKKLSYNTLVMRISVMRSLCEYIRYRREQQSISYYNYFNDIIVPDQDKTLLEENLPTDSEINALLELAADADDDTAFWIDENYETLQEYFIVPHAKEKMRMLADKSVMSLSEHSIVLKLLKKQS